MDIEKDVIDIIKNKNMDIIEISNGKIHLVDIDGYKYVSTKSNIKQGKTPSVISTGNIYSMENLQIAVLNNSNTKILSNEYISNSSKIKLLCECGEEFETTPSKILYSGKTKCNKCSNRGAIRNKKDKQLGLFLTFLNANGYTLLSEYKDCDTNVELEDDFGYKYFVIPKQLYINGSYPRPFNVKNPYTIYNIKKYIDKNNIKSQLVSEIYTGNGNDHKLCFQCECGEIFYRPLNTFRLGATVCDKCSLKIKGMRHRTSVIKIKHIFREKGLIPLFDEYDPNLKLKYSTSDGYICETTLDSISMISRPNTISVFNPYTMHNIKMMMSKNNFESEIISSEWNGTQSLYKFRCKNCGLTYEMIWDVFISRDKKVCRKCAKSISKNEYLVAKFLKDNDVSFVFQKRFKKCKNKNPLPFECYIKESNCCIEVDGEHHFQPVCFGGASEEDSVLRHEQTRINDEIKNEYCRNNGIKLIRIPYWEFKSNQYINIIKNGLLK